MKFVEISSEPEVKFGYEQIEDGTDINNEYLQTEKWKQGIQITEKWTNWKHNLLGDFNVHKFTKYAIDELIADIKFML